MRYRCITILCVIIKKRLQIILCITLKELVNSLIKYEYNLIVLPCPGSSFLVIKTRRVTLTCFISTWVDLKKFFLAKMHRANEKNISVIFMELIKKLIIIIIITPSQQVFSYLLSTTRWNSGIHVNECDNYCGQSAKPVSSPAHVYISLYHANE